VIASKVFIAEAASGVNARLLWLRSASDKLQSGILLPSDTRPAVSLHLSSLLACVAESCQELIEGWKLHDKDNSSLKCPSTQSLELAGAVADALECLTLIIQAGLPLSQESSDPDGVSGRVQTARMSIRTVLGLV